MAFELSREPGHAACTTLFARGDKARLAWFQKSANKTCD
jgi:hypothetical protein